jgi:putative transposase
VSKYRRYFVPGGTYFFTVVTYRRRRFLTSELTRRILHDSIESTRQKLPFRIVAMVLLPDHLHTVWTLPSGDVDYSTRWRTIKSDFTSEYLAAGGKEARISISRKKRGERGIWQRRFWEHTVRDESDLKRCVDYIHWNPRKHKLVDRVKDWEYSTFHRFVSNGEYGIDWGGEDPTPGYEAPEWGE